MFLFEVTNALRQSHLLIYIIEKESLFTRYAPVNHSVKSLSHGATDVEVAVGSGRSQSNIQQTLSCKVPETRPEPATIPTARGGFLPRDVARESRKSDKPYRRLNARRPSGNKSGNLPPVRTTLLTASVFRS